MNAISPVIQDTVAGAKTEEEAMRRARLALTEHPECFWTRKPGVPLTDRDDILLVIRRLREHGGRNAWLTANAIEECL